MNQGNQKRRRRGRRGKSSQGGNPNPNQNNQAKNKRSGRRGGGGGNRGPLKEVRGLLSVTREGFGFLRLEENSFASVSGDVFVPQQLINRYDLRPGIEVVGGISAQASGKRRPLLSITSVEGAPPEDFAGRPHFKTLVSETPSRRINLETDDSDLSLRIIDLVTPMGFGQRALIVAPPRTGKTILLQKLTRAIVTNHPEATVMVVLVDERPEEVTDFKRSCEGAEIYSSSFDKDASTHVDLCEMILERCRRRVEDGKDVVVLFDSLTRMARAFNNERGKSGRTLSGGLDAQAMQKPREIFGAARESGEGSLTMIATALIDTGSKLDKVIFEEFKGTGNLELVLTRDLADHRIFPAIDVRESGTRREERLRVPEEMERINVIRRMLTRSKPREAMQALLKKLGQSQNNAAFLMGLPV